MEKKVPGVFANKVDKNIGNNKKVYYSGQDERGNLEKSENESLSRSSILENLKKGTRNINQKINDIFNSSNYIYKADVELKLKSGTVTKRIVGKNATHLITIENELIPISDIVDIKRK